MQKNSLIHNSRLSFVDQCKGIGIILMVYGHCTTTEFMENNYFAKTFASWFTSFHMPLFFIIGGCLLAYKDEVFVFPNTLVKKSKGLLLPGLYFSVLSIAFYALLKVISKENVLQYIIDNVLNIFTLKFLDAMWFLPCYFFAEIIFLLLLKIAKQRWWTIVVFLFSFIIALFLNIFSGNIFTRLSRLMMAICFVSIGHLAFQLLISRWYGFKSNKEQQKDNECRNNKGNKNRLIIGASGIILLALGFVGSLFNGRVECVGASYGKFPILFIFDAIAGSLGLILVFAAINRSIRPLEFFGKNSLVVLCTHMFIIESFWVINGHLIHIELGSVNAFVFAMGVIAIEIPIILVINRFFPFIISRKVDNKRI